MEKENLRHTMKLNEHKILDSLMAKENQIQS